MTLELSNSTGSPKLAVIVPVYKVEKYLPKCLDSIINQTYKNLQIICVDDGSPDKCGAILDDYAKKDSRITVIHKANGGLSSARNAALDFLYDIWLKSPNCFLEYITFVDSDDYLDLNAYENLLRNFDNDIDVISYGFEHVYYNAVYRENDRLQLSNYLGLSGKFELTDDLLPSLNVMVWNKIFRAQIVFRNRICFPQGLIFEDTFFTPAYLIHSKNVFFDNRYFYKYLIRDDSITGKNSLKNSGIALHPMRISKELLEYLSSKKLLESKLSYFLTVFYICLDRALATAANETEVQKVYEHANKLMFQVSKFRRTGLQKRKEELIRNKAFYGFTRFKYLFIFKHKCRAEYDKYYVLGIPLIKISYFDDCKDISVLGVFRFVLK